MKIPQPLVEPEIDWQAALVHLDERGFTVLPSILAKEACEQIAAFYLDERQFRSRIDMARYSFGRGEYKYFDYPLPLIIEELRASLYPRLAPLANEWNTRLGNKQSRFPKTLSEFTQQCHRAGQKRATPLILKYGPGDFNC